MSRLPLHRAEKHGCYEIAVELLNRNSDQSIVDAQNDFGKYVHTVIQPYDFRSMSNVLFSFMITAHLYILLHLGVS